MSPLTTPMEPRVDAARLEAERLGFKRAPRPRGKTGLDEERLLCTWGLARARQRRTQLFATFRCSRRDQEQRAGHGPERTDEHPGLVDPGRRGADAEPGDGH